MRDHTTLHFLREDIAYAPDLFSAEPCSLQWFIPVVSYPTAEMLTRTPSGIAWEFFTHTTSLSWHTRLRRAVRPGDVFTFDNQCWMYIPAHHIEAFDGLPVQHMDWNDLHLRIVQLSSEQRYDQLDRRNICLHDNGVRR
jgi:hypothetical protein